ncbi:PREDICTED: olfactory receptor 5V1-like [Thamnophis sirtalis]|uniref:Olfactory receptor n=1 Tax=Thamnophis sirtalis TaxID=35019 RepID=A0A6I9YS36_9SAUR|nr:PREDICTED: olfactory receptor 5V1-like [Thamnophis sirtalis]
MEQIGNQSDNRRTFSFLGYSITEPHVLFFILFLAIYITTLFGNGLILTTTWLDVGLQTPMYFFIRHLSFLDICYISVTLPHLLKNLLNDTKTISIQGCLTQLYFLVAFVGVECLLLTTMAYDRYIAICYPLNYEVVMNSRVCNRIAVASWACGFLNSILHTVMTAQLPFCVSHSLEHIFCDVPQLLKLSCVDTFPNQMTLLAVTMILGIIPFLFILISYAHIVMAVLKIRSTQGRHKVFSTCTSHIIVVTLFYATCAFNYNRPSSSHSFFMDILASLLFNVITPMLNPIIYCLRNKEMKKAMGRVFRFKGTSFIKVQLFAGI